MILLNQLLTLHFSLTKIIVQEPVEEMTNETNQIRKQSISTDVLKMTNTLMQKKGLCCSAGAFSCMPVFISH